MKAQLFVTCLAEQFFPDTLKAMVAVLERLGVDLQLPSAQTCCGQPLFNSGFQSQARELASRWIDTFALSDGYIISPSGSCVDMVRHHYPELFPEGSPHHQLASDVAARTFELSEFLVDVLRVTDLGARFPHKVTYHPSCHLLRGLQARTQAKTLLKSVKGLELVALDDEETCCGFGGAFSVIYPEVSRSMMQEKIKAIEASGSQAVVACDPGCLMNIGGGLNRRGSQVKAMHLAEVLAAGSDGQ